MPDDPSSNAAASSCPLTGRKLAVAAVATAASLAVLTIAIRRRRARTIQTPQYKMPEGTSHEA